MYFGMIQYLIHTCFLSENSVISVFTLELYNKNISFNNFSFKVSWYAMNFVKNSSWCGHPPQSIPDIVAIKKKTFGRQESLDNLLGLRIARPRKLFPVFSYFVAYFWSNSLKSSFLFELCIAFPFLPSYVLGKALFAFKSSYLTQ